MHERHDHHDRSNQGEGVRDSKGDVFEPERATLFPTAEPGGRGRDRPRRDNRVSILTRLLRRKFGALPPAILTRMATADASEVDVWLERVLFAATLDDVFAPLQ